jgi:hypothetical protein
MTEYQIEKTKYAEAFVGLEGQQPTKRTKYL